jgi:hypothetical protein
MAKIHWKERFSKGGVCDFRENYDFFFKWLLNKVASCFVLENVPETINTTYLKTNLILEGNICITDFGDKLYACIGSVGSAPNEYYIPRKFIIANPVLGSKTVTFLPEDGNIANGVVITNTDIDSLFSFDVGLYELINQTATLLADNIISISCAQINSRITAIITAESGAQQTAAETTMKQMYAGRPYQVLQSDLVEKIMVNPINTSAVGNNLTELVELHNYIIGNFFQSIGIKSNNIRKKAHVLNEEIDSQNEFLKVSIMEMLTSWQKGFDKVNELYGTDIKVTLNPALVDTVLENNESDDFSPEMQETISNSEEVTDSEYDDTADEDTAENETNSEEISSENEDSDIVSELEEAQEEITEVIELAMDKTESEVTEDDSIETQSDDVAESE